MFFLSAKETLSIFNVTKAGNEMLMVSSKSLSFHRETREKGGNRESMSQNNKFKS